jgi:hypothetical protein
MGAFALPFSMEHNGPFRSCNLTITPSIINTVWEGVRPYGLEIQPVKDVKPEDIQWKFGIVSATDDILTIPMPFFSDVPAHINGAEADDGFGFYVQIGKSAPADGGLAWNLTYFDNGGDRNLGIANIELDAIQLGISYSTENLLFMTQYADLTINDTDIEAFYFLVNYKIDNKNNITLRYDDLNVEWLPTDQTADGITFAWNYKVSENSMMQLEYVAPDNSDGELDDDMFQIRYKVHF